MSYTPLNLCIYVAAQAGYNAGSFAARAMPYDSNEADYVNSAERADFFAQAVDQAWGSGGFADADLRQIQSASAAVWNPGRSPVTGPAGLTQAGYATLAAGLVAATLAGTAQIVAEGINPNGCGGSSNPGGLLPLAADNNHTGSPISISAGVDPGTIVVSVTVTPKATGKLCIWGTVVAQSTGEGGDTGNIVISHGAAPVAGDFDGASVTVPGPTNSSSQLAIYVEYGTTFGGSAQPAFPIGVPVQINLAVGSVSGALEVLDKGGQLSVMERST